LQVVAEKRVMRTGRNRDGTYNVWMTRAEYQGLSRQARTDQQEIALRLMGDCGLRCFGVPDVAPAHISRMGDGRHYELEVVAGKDTTGVYEGGKHRETWSPVDPETGVSGGKFETTFAPERWTRRTGRPTSPSVAIW
jgi:hypothetical protein